MNNKETRLIFLQLRIINEVVVIIVIIRSSITLVASVLVLLVLFSCLTSLILFPHALKKFLEGAKASVSDRFQDLGCLCHGEVWVRVQNQVNPVKLLTAALDGIFQ